MQRRPIAGSSSRLKDVFDRILDPRDDLLDEADIPLLEKVLVEVLVADFVGRLKLTIVVRVLLNSVVRQVNQSVVDLVGRVVLARGT